MKTLRLSRQQNSVIYRDEKVFTAWPFNQGVYKYKGDEIVVFFLSKPCEYTDLFQVNHGFIPPGMDGYENMKARSKNGGRSWEITRAEEAEHVPYRLAKLKDLPTPSKTFDFKSPDLMIRHLFGSGYGKTPGFILLSEDRGKTFEGPFVVPWCRWNNVDGRPDYVIRDDGACILGTTLHDGNENEACAACLISKNGGISWTILSMITPKNPFYMQIMPSLTLLPDGGILAAIRVQRYSIQATLYSDCYYSGDGGRTWTFRSRINDHGAPCHLLHLDDGRILATYGYRVHPFGIRCSISADEGKTWDNEIVIRDDGGSWDLGYPKSVQLDNGEILSAYYFNDRNDKVNIDGGVRHIACTRWSLSDII